MRNRRVAAYGIDLGIFFILSVLSFWIGYEVSGFLGVIVGLLLFILLQGVVFGVVPMFLRSTIGKKIMDLKVMPTTGMMTPVRFLLRDVGGKYLVFVPFAIGFANFIDNLSESENTFIVSGAQLLVGFYTGFVISAILVIGLVAANLYFWIQKKELLVDLFFFTKVEDDIPTAMEYEDLSTFLHKTKEGS
jgi:hypothetical protein